MAQLIGKMSERIFVSAYQLARRIGQHHIAHKHQLNILRGDA
jgi:hypothetical protein